MAQCEASGIIPGRQNFGKQCRRNAVHGSTFCAVHGGKDDTTTPEKLRTRFDRMAQKCTATKRDGNPCGAYAIRGGRVCMKHGGNIPNVRNKAKELLQEMVEPSLVQLNRIISKSDTSDADRLRAIGLVLDRTGYNAKSELGVQVEIKPWETTLQGIIRTAPAGSQQELPEFVVDALEDEPAPWTGWSDEDDEEPDEPAPRRTGSSDPPPGLRW